MIEQTIRKYDRRSEQLWKKIFRVLQVISIFLLGTVAYFGFSVNSIYWHIDRAVFWQACASLLLMCLPIALFILLFHVLICKMGLEYDYELSGSTVAIYRLLGSRRKHYMTFDLNNVTLVRATDTIRPDSPEQVLLRRARPAGCNEDAPHRYLLQVNECLFHRRLQTLCVVVELNPVFYAAWSRKLPL